MHFDFPTTVAKEGLVEVLVPKFLSQPRKKSDCTPCRSPVFYNPIMELNRDISVLAIQCYQRSVRRELRISEPMTGCGIRGIRYAAEIEGVANVLLSDLDPLATDLARCNTEKNHLTNKVKVECAEANTMLALHGSPRKRFDVIDIDPFGSPSPYMDSAIRAISNRGFLAFTATDMAPLCGVRPLACLRKYGGRPLRTEYCHEIAVRLLVGCLAVSAARNEVGVEVVLSHSTDHYVRVFAIARHGAEYANRGLAKMGYIQHCFNCLNRETVKRIKDLDAKCDICGNNFSLAGSLWLGELFDERFSQGAMEELEQRNLRNRNRIANLLGTIMEEAKGPPTYYVVDRICDKLEILMPSLGRVLETLEKRGYLVTPTHFRRTGFRTNAKTSEVMKAVGELSPEA